MKNLPKDDAEESFNLFFGLLMSRFKKAGMITGWKIPSDPSDQIRIDWNPAYKGMGGEEAFLGLSSLLADICRDSPLSTDEQALIQMLRQTHWAPGDEK